MNKLTGLIIVAIFALIGLAIGVVVREITIPTTGEIAIIDTLCLDAGGSAVLTLNWGVTENATPWVYDPIIITNVGNVPVTYILDYNNTINLIALDLTWNYTDQVVYPEESIVVILEQTASSNLAAGTLYTYDTVITAVEYEEP